MCIQHILFLNIAFTQIPSGFVSFCILQIKSTMCISENQHNKLADFESFDKNKTFAIRISVQSNMFVQSESTFLCYLKFLYAIQCHF